jgi:hypothetical protein
MQIMTRKRVEVNSWNALVMAILALEVNIGVFEALCMIFELGNGRFLNPENTKIEISRRLPLKAVAR